jgi:hypothetical protein
MMGNYEVAIANLEETIKVINRIIDGNKAKDQSAFRTRATEVTMLIMTVYERQPGTPLNFQKIQSYEDTLVKIQGSDKTI